MIIQCKYDELVSVDELTPHPKNRNQHSHEQVERLSKLLIYQGVRAPIIVSKLSGHIVKGHGTLEAIKLNSWLKAPVVYQDFKDADQEYAFVQSDNAIASWAGLDLSGINSDLADLGPDFDLDLLGVKDFTLDFLPDNLPDPIEAGDDEYNPDFYRVIILLKQDEHKDIIGEAKKIIQTNNLTDMSELFKFLVLKEKLK